MAVRVASWVLEEEEKSLRCNVIFLLKSGLDGVHLTRVWMDRVWEKCLSL